MVLTVMALSSPSKNSWICEQRVKKGRRQKEWNEEGGKENRGERKREWKEGRTTERRADREGEEGRKVQRKKRAN